LRVGLFGTTINHCCAYLIPPVCGVREVLRI
jgi:hypothetical protein